MVTRTDYEEDEHSFRRYSYRGHGGYPITYQERDLPSGPGHNVYSRPPHPGSQDSPNGDRSSDIDEIPRTRSRIPVACGRCRKRKIKCSGDNGGPCTNCKSAGNNECIFLRVSSTETHLKSETSNYDFDPGSAGSRVNCRMIPFGPHSYASQGPPLSFGPYPGRNNSMPAYQYGAKQYYSAYGDFADDSVDYGVNLQYQPLLPGEQIGLGTTNFDPSPEARAWIAAQPQPLKSLPFLDGPTQIYSHGQSSYNGSNYDPRSNISVDLKPIQLTGMSSSLPNLASPGNDRQLPFPANVPVSRPTQLNQYLPPAEGILTGTQTRGPYMDFGTVQTIKSQNNNAVADNNSMPTSSYLPVANDSPQSLNSSQSTYSAPTISLPSPQPEVYTPSQGSNDGLLNATDSFSPRSSSSYHSIVNNDSSNDAYNHRGSRNERGSYSRNPSDGLPSMTTGLLANGQQYSPAPSAFAPNRYPAPPVEMHPQPRRQSGVLA
ncbi:uncharacterized protein LY89DRAFT_36455 [Mollisia scopiformis]|uniref:Zn(2)-C6 fungal-type domain-containing protein n=1 Tax=Mollisia scopiformis TaxID=149040 RepID=A0A194XE74_MOLSC|nr:uncharacterized protein LY89DRAFT_36455 [Mollisia scopiformis]KUJ18062.1 hypothetical protein LY89DRAFT_36455 [Mollisia scopiformis]